MHLVHEKPNKLDSLKKVKMSSESRLAASSGFPENPPTGRQGPTLKVLKLVCISLNVEVGLGIGPSLVDSRPVKGTSSVDLCVMVAQGGGLAPS